VHQPAQLKEIASLQSMARKNVQGLSSASHLSVRGSAVSPRIVTKEGFIHTAQRHAAGDMHLGRHDRVRCSLLKLHRGGEARGTSRAV